jgi:polysaccharide export outer membrane protein
VGDVAVRGKTIEEVRALLTERFREVIPSAELSIFLKQGDVLVDSFLEAAMDEGAAGASQRMRVRYDGLVNFPLIGEVQVAGKSLPEFTAGLETSYDEIFRGGVAVTVNMVSSTAGNIAILGEVARPGMYTLYSSMHPLYALAMAGGSLHTAGLDRAILIKRFADGGLVRYRLDLTVEGRDEMPDVRMGPSDVLVIPKSGIANVNLWVEQYLRKMVPFNMGAGAYYQLDNGN